MWNRASVFLLIHEKLVGFLNAPVMDEKHTGSGTKLAHTLSPQMPTVSARGTLGKD